MAISYNETATLACPSCGERFATDLWLLIDADERPDLAQALREGALNIVTCPHCAYHGPGGAAMLFHDPANRRVYFAAPPNAEEHELREQAQSLLYKLVESLPEAARRPYLGDLQVEQEVEGVRRAILRRERGQRRAPGSGPVSSLDPTPSAHGAEHHVVESAPPPAPPEPSPLFAVVQDLLAANSSEEFAALVDERPLLLDPSADLAFVQLIEAAYDQGDRAIATALQEARLTLAELRATRTGQQPPARPDSAHAPDQAAAPILSAPRLADAAYQALLRAASADELIAAVHDYPALLEKWADDELMAHSEAALDQGAERLARDIEERREALAELRDGLTGQTALNAAIQTLLRAADEDAFAQAIDEHPILLTDAAQEALFAFAAQARTQGDQRAADRALELRAMLRAVRDGLEEET